MESKTKTNTIETPSYHDFEPYGEWQREEGRETLILHLPDFKKEQLRIQVNNQGVLKISGERPLNENGTERKRFYKETRAPNGCDINQIRAKLISGQLRIIMPKKITPSHSKPHSQPPIEQLSSTQQQQQQQQQQPPQKMDQTVPQTPDAKETSGIQEKMTTGEPNKEKIFGLGMMSISDSARLRVRKKMAVTAGVAVLAMVAIGAYAVYKYKSSSIATNED